MDMPLSRLSICLNMIVKDEAHVIERCLASVKPYIDQWVIVDTGSTDGTQDIIRRFLADLPGELHERPWRDFGTNRSEALDLARTRGGHILIIDADNIFHAPPDWSWPELSAPAYYLDMDSSGTRYRQCLLVSAALPWRWVGVLHEYLKTDAPHHIEPLEGPWVERRHEGARSRDPNVFRKDAALLQKALEAEPDNTRYVFYLAQSWRDAGEPAKAREAYARRAAMGGWAEEVWYALYQIGVLGERLALPPEDIRSAYLNAYAFRPGRAEPLVALARWHNNRREWAMARLYARAAMNTPRPADILFMDDNAYRWGAMDEASISSYWLGDHLESFQLAMHLLDQDLLPESERARVETNRDYSAPAVTAQTTLYPQARIAQLATAAAPSSATGQSQADVTFTVTTCKRLDLFERTMNSFLNCCTDLHRIARFVCVDDNSSPEDRERMQTLYPFFEFIFKTDAEKGHARSMNLLREKVATAYWLHMEDDWEFLVEADYIGRATEVLDAEPELAQVVFNRNYAETLANRSLVGGVVKRHPISGKRYVLHEHVPPEGHAAFFQKHPPGVLSNMWWPHFSLQPSLMRADRILSLGPFKEEGSHFEQDFARRFMAEGFRTAFFDMTVCQHIGRLIAERGSGKLNAYELNGVQQF